MSFLKTNDGIQIHYQLDGPHNGTIILLLGGYTSNIATWTPQIEAFNAAGYRTLRLDYRSHGQSEQTAQGLRIARLAMDVAELLQQLDIKAVYIIGHSMGASVGELYLSLFGNQKVLSIITEDQSPKMLNEGEWQAGLKGSDLRQLGTFAERFPHIKLTQKHLSSEIKKVLAENYTPFDFKLTHSLLLDGIAQDWRDVLPTEQRPHLFMSGDASPLYPANYPEIALKLQRNPQSQTYHFEGVGHVPHLEAADEFNQVALAFFDQIN
ncbi:alpha/beta fold hydrolase [Weissella kandleri]|uniref:alpha/beta fold hydrolase n=1 Tax=Weissella kandleri TaxID=1616 RepID=UPI00387E960F